MITFLEQIKGRNDSVKRLHAKFWYNQVTDLVQMSNVSFHLIAFGDDVL